LITVATIFFTHVAGIPCARPWDTWPAR